MKTRRVHSKKRGTRRHRRGGGFFDYFRSTPKYSSVPTASNCEMEMRPIIQQKDAEIRRLGDELKRSSWESSMGDVMSRSRIQSNMRPTSPYRNQLTSVDQARLQSELARYGGKHRKSHRRRRHSRR